MHHLTRICLEYPKTTVLLFALLTAVMGVGATRVQTVYGHRVLIGDDHPSIVHLDRFMSEFGGGLPAVVMWDCEFSSGCEHPLDLASLELANDFVRTLLPMPEVRDVVGPTNAPLLLKAPDGFAVRHLMENGEIPTDYDWLVSKAYEDDLWLGEIISTDRQAGLLLIQPITDKAPADEHIVDELLRLKQKWEDRGFALSLGGSVVDSVVGTRELIASQSALTPVTVILTGVVLYLLSGSLRRSVFSLVSVGAALMWAVGTTGFLAWPQDSIFQVLAPLVLIVGVCDAIHYLGRAQSLWESGLEWEESLGEAARDVSVPCALTTATTAAAFLSFLTSGLDTFLRFGTIAAIGVVACLFVTFSLLPALCSLMDTPQSAQASTHDPIAAAAREIARLSVSRAGTVLSCAAAILVLFGIGWATMLGVGVDWQESFGENSEIVSWDRQLENRFGPSEMRLEVELLVPEETFLEEPNSVAVIDGVVRAIGQVAGFIDLRSVLDYMRRMNQMVDHGASPGSLPDSIGGNAEILELLSFGDQDFLDYWLSFDRRRVRVSAKGVTWSSRDVDASIENAEAAIERALPTGWSFSLTGAIPITRDWVNEVQATQLRSFPVAFVIVWLMASVFLGSLSLGLISMAPSLLPVVMTLGAMGWLGMSLDISRAMIAAIIIGIGVDDSIHILSHYRGLARSGVSPVDAILGAAEAVGRPVVTTSLALAVGFLSLMASAWQSISSFGFFVSLAILGALVSTLVVLPALIAATVRVRGWVEGS